MNNDLNPNQITPENPYAASQHGGIQPHYYNSASDEKTHSPMGHVSFWSSLTGFLCVTIGTSIMIRWSMNLAQNMEHLEEDALTDHFMQHTESLMYCGLAIGLGFIISVIAFILCIIALCQEHRAKALPITGIVLSGIIVLLGLIGIFGAAVI